MRVHAKYSCVLLLALSAACSPTVAQQAVPVSTDPAAAEVLVDGQRSCATPCTVQLTRNQDHILTIQKDGYRQQDVIIKRQYQSEKVLLNAINSGYGAGSFFNNAAWGLQSGVQSIDSQEQSGEAYTLHPSTVSLRMTPIGGFPRTSEASDAAAIATDGQSPLAFMDQSDEHMLENALETTPSGQTVSWRNAATGIAFAAMLHPASNEGGRVVRQADLGAQKDGQKYVGHVMATRVGRGEWQVGQPQAATTDAPQDSLEIGTAPLLKALGESSLPSARMSTGLGSSSSSKTTQSADGAIRTTTTKTSAKASVSVGPEAVLGILDALGGSGM